MREKKKDRGKVTEGREGQRTLGAWLRCLAAREAARGRHTAVPALGEPGTEMDIKELIINRSHLSGDHHDGLTSWLNYWLF